MALKQQRLPALRAAAENFFDVGAEADVEHAVGFVEHDELELVELQRAAAEVVEDAAGRADDDVGALLQPVDLRAERLAAVDGRGANLAAVGQPFDFVADLHGQLARGHQDQGAAADGRGRARRAVREWGWRTRPSCRCRCGPGRARRRRRARGE